MGSTRKVSDISDRRFPPELWASSAVGAAHRPRASTGTATRSADGGILMGFEVSVFIGGLALLTCRRLRRSW
jgi:hypothetical protein